MKAKLKKIAAGIAAAFTTPAAVKAEKSAAVFAIQRIVIGIGGTAATADIIVRLVNVLGY